jgi:hypothetical protein
VQPNLSRSDRSEPQLLNVGLGSVVDVLEAVPQIGASGAVVHDRLGVTVDFGKLRAELGI